MEFTTLIGTCDSYRYLWNNFDKLYRKYVFQPDISILVGQTIGFEGGSYTNVLPGSNLPWGQRILMGLELIETQYVFFVLQDYFFTTPILQQSFIEHMQMMQKYNAVKASWDMHSYEYSLAKLVEPNWYRFLPSSRYLNSVQPALWNTQYMKMVLKRQYSPWDFEILGNEFARELDKPILIQVLPQATYFNMVRRGGILSQGWQKIYNNQNLQIQRG